MPLSPTLPPVERARPRQVAGSEPEHRLAEGDRERDRQRARRGRLPGRVGHRYRRRSVVERDRRARPVGLNVADVVGDLVLVRVASCLRSDRSYPSQASSARSTRPASGTPRSHHTSPSQRYRQTNPARACRRRIHARPAVSTRTEAHRDRRTLHPTHPRTPVRRHRAATGRRRIVRERDRRRRGGVSGRVCSGHDLGRRAGRPAHPAEPGRDVRDPRLGLETIEPANVQFATAPPSEPNWLEAGPEAASPTVSWSWNEPALEPW